MIGARKLIILFFLATAVHNLKLQGNRLINPGLSGKPLEKSVHVFVTQTNSRYARTLSFGL